jgi:transposase
MPNQCGGSGALTADLREMARWLVEKGVQSVAMQSTGVYWMPVFEVLEQHGLAVFLVNARHTKNVPGRKSEDHKRSRKDLLIRG